MDRRDSEAPALAKAAGPAAAMNGTGGGGGGGGGAALADASFDTNTVILLAALFLALLFAIALNSLARCALWCGGRAADGGGGGRGEGASSSSSVVGASCAGVRGGIKKRALRSIPVEVYARGGDGGDEEAGAGDEDVCAICLGEFADGEKVRVLPRCGHGFHVPCVDAWLLSRGSCPTCRRPVMDAKGGGGGGGGVRGVGQSRRRSDSDTIAVVIA